MVFQMFPGIGQIRLAKQATTGLVAFDVDPTVSPWFLQVVAVGPSCQPLRGRAPDIELRAGQGLITAVPQQPAKAAVPDETGKTVATASWTRDATDVFTVQLEIDDPGVAAWNLRITNNDPQELGFVWTSAPSDAEGRQPRIQMATSLDVNVLETTADQVVPVANIGPGTLTFGGSADMDMGAGFVLHSFPAGLPTNTCGQIVIRIASGGQFAVPSQTAHFTLDCNDTVAGEKTLQLTREQKKVGKEGKEFKDKEKDVKDKEHKDHVGKELETHVPAPPGRGFGAGSGQGSEHFIPADQRPDLADSALGNEDPETGPGRR
ncbi:hypothetical protein [Kitasatospora sp. NPDC097691]|uniref:hypothetical protein n=1 Tax=Kitasatospora sp. NPDC097691 TaxID=3157231 RepID=UPI0033165521